MKSAALVSRYCEVLEEGSPDSSRASSGLESKGDDDTLPGTEGAIVVVDDNEDNRELLRLLLEACGYPVYATSSARNALRVLAHLPRPRLVLLDFMMPEMSGIEVLDAMRGDKALARVPVVFVTGAEEMGEIHDAHVLHKPFEPDELLALVEDLTAAA